MAQQNRERLAEARERFASGETAEAAAILGEARQHASRHQNLDDVLMVDMVVDELREELEGEKQAEFERLSGYKRSGGSNDHRGRERISSRGPRRSGCGR